MNFDIDEHLVLKVKAGSHAYGTNTEDSDEDLRGVIIPPEEYFIGLKSFEQYCPDDGDICYYDIRKFFRLALQGNPNAIEIFHSPRLEVKLPFGGTILDMWNQVISKQIVKPHLGMAKAHLMRLDKPGRNCGKKGRKMIERFGYNCKDASHIVRILHQCLEILKTGELTLPRPEANFILNIKRGHYKIETIVQEYVELKDEIREWEQKSELPDRPNFDEVSKNVSSIVHGWIYWKRSNATPIKIWD